MNQPAIHAETHDTYIYALRTSLGVATYVGITNAPDRRASEHRTNGKLGDLLVEKGPMQRSKALAIERLWQRQLDGQLRMMSLGIGDFEMRRGF